MSAIRAIVRGGKIEFLEPVEVSEGSEVLVMVPDNKFWLAVSDRALEPIWDNPEDNVYEQLLQAYEADDTRHE